MPPKREPCRNFLRGSCQYGDRCKFLHVAPQQSRPNNPFGFGTQNQQQKSNPFGFGVQNSQPRGANTFGSTQNQFKPFENKWSRSSAINNANSSKASQQPENQSSAATHKCTDPDSCKRQFVEDFQNERPSWKLTCYGHSKNGPCDIIGDMSYEELRAAAYDDAKRGMNIQSIVQRERSMVQAKLAEFESLVRNSYAGPSCPAPSSTVTGQINGTPSVSSFSQLGAAVGTGISSTAPNTLFGQPNPFQNLNPGPPNSNPLSQPSSFQNLSGSSSAFGQTNATFGNAGVLAGQLSPQTRQSSMSSNSASFSNNPSGAERNPFLQFSSFQNLSSSSSAFGPKNTIFGNAGISTSQSTHPTQQSLFTSNTGSLSDGTSGAQRNPFSTPAIPTQISGSAANQSPNHVAATTSSDGTQMMNSFQRESGCSSSIWTKSKWTAGEIPEEAPPDEYVF